MPHSPVPPGPSRHLTTSDFDYPVPDRLIAQEPLPDRAESRLLVRRQDGSLLDRRVSDLPDELPAGALVILNNTRVFPSRLFGTLPTGANVELFLLEPATSMDEAPREWRALARPMRKLDIGKQLDFGAGLLAAVTAIDRGDPGMPVATVSFNLEPEALAEWLGLHGYIPLPPYIKRPDAVPASASRDASRYQTVYAQRRGSVAAPTAGLHFTAELLADLAARGVETAPVTLHVGGGTFLPVKSESPGEHRMHAESYMVPTSTAEAVVRARREGRPVVAVGTTSFRALEDLAWRCRQVEVQLPALADRWLSTNLYLRPETAADRYTPHLFSALMTNFHQPRSTLFMLICALIGFDAAHAMYRQAIAAEYRLFSYGDASLIWLA